MVLKKSCGRRQKLGKKSLQEVELHDFIRRHTAWRNKLKPPFLCPICCQEETVRVTKTEISIKVENKYLYGNIFRLWCEKGCFDVEVKFDSLCYEYVDAYCKVVDKILTEKEKLYEN